MRKVSYTKFHQGLFCPGLGNVGDTLPSPSKTLKGLSMTWDNDGLTVSTNTVSFVVPVGNIVICVFEADAKPSMSLAKPRATAVA